MRNNPLAFSCICIHSLSLLISALGTAIFTLATLIVFLVTGAILTALAVISAVFFLVMLIALIQFLHCLMRQTCRPSDDDPFRDRR